MTAIAHAVSTALLHFVWQGLLVAFLLWTALALLSKRSANARYVASCTALAALTAMPVITAWVVYLRPVATRPGTVDLVKQAGGLLANPLAARIDWLALIQTLIQTWMLPVWSCGVMLFSLRLLWGCRQVSAFRRSGEPAQHTVAAMVARLAARMRVTRPVRVLMSSVADSPSVVGWLRPVILLPAATVLGLTAEQLEAVLAHELAHIQRYDYLVNILQMLVETLFFYHPAVWWLSGRIRHERELCCDDAAVLCCGDSVCYARALTTLERLRVMAPVLALGVTDGPLMYRVQRLLGETTREYGPSRLPAALAICLAMVCLGLNMNRARAQARSSAPLVEDRPGVNVDLRGSSLMHRPAVSYPETAQAKDARGTVTVEVTLDAQGNVTDAHVLSGPDEFRKTVLQSVLTWHFASGAAGSKQQVDIAFQPPPAASQPSGITADAVFEGNRYAFTLGAESGSPMSLGINRSRENREQEARQIQESIRRAEAGAGRALTTRELKAAVPEAMSRLAVLERGLLDVETSGRTLGSIEIRGLSDAARNELLARLPLHVGDVLAAGSIPAARQAVRQFEEHLELRASPRDDGSYNFQIFPAGSAREWGTNRYEK